MTKKIFHEFNLIEECPNGSPAECNEALFKLYLQIALLNGHKICQLICGTEVAKLLAQLSGDHKELKDEEFYKMGSQSLIPIYVDKTISPFDILVVCKKGIEKIRVIYHF